MKSLLISAFFLIVILVAASQAHALTAECTDWPTASVGFGPSNALAGMALTYNFRLSCALGARFSAEGVTGEYSSPEGDLPGLGFYSYPLSAGEILYQDLFSPPSTQAAGIYIFNGCAQIKNVESGEQRCVPLPSSQMKMVLTAELSANPKSD